MKQKFLLSPKILIQLSFVLIILASCVPQKKVLLLQKTGDKDTITDYSHSRFNEYKVQAKDNLYIKISSLDEKSYQFFNRQGMAAGTENYNNDASIYLNSYSIDDEGNIELPVLGKIFVKDMNVKEISGAIQKMLDEYLKQTMVTVKLINFNITIIGEVNRPGELKVYQDRISLFEAISLAGDMTEYANRNEVALVRQTKNGSSIHYLDLTSKKILSSEFYYLMPKDVLIVSPLNIKRWGFTQFPYNTVIASFSLIISLIILVYTVKP